MTFDWVLQNLVAWSLQSATLIGVTALCLAVLRVRAVRPRLRALETTFGMSLVLAPTLSIVGYMHNRPLSTLPRFFELSSGVSQAVDAVQRTAPWSMLVVIVWVCGSLVRAAWLLSGWRRLRPQSDGPPTESIAAEAQPLQELLRTRARIEWRRDLAQPATLGLFRPRVLLPATLADDDAARRRSILCHELIHVRRADFGNVVIEELVRTLFWFHVPLRWLIAELRIVREQAVDLEVVERLGNRVSYVELLYAFASGRPSGAGVAPFFGRRQLRRRVTSLLKEVRMSRLHKVAAFLITSALAGGATGVASYRYPLDLFAAGVWQTTQDEDGAPGSLERVADGGPRRVGGSVGPPKKVVTVAPTYPPEALSAGIQGVVVIEATIDVSGAVSEARVVQSISELNDAALEAVRQWKYSPTLIKGAAVPVIMTVTINFSLPQQD